MRWNPSRLLKAYPARVIDETTGAPAGSRIAVDLWRAPFGWTDWRTFPTLDEARAAVRLIVPTHDRVRFRAVQQDAS